MADDKRTRCGLLDSKKVRTPGSGERIIMDAPTEKVVRDIKVILPPRHLRSISFARTHQNGNNVLTTARQNSSNLKIIRNVYHNSRKYTIYKYKAKHLIHAGSFIDSKIEKRNSLPEINTNSKIIMNNSKIKNKHLIQHACNNKNTVNTVNGHRVPVDFSKRLQTSYKVYRCQISTKEESCCCSCNSDAMFEVMKSLYDCYKMKNCDNCNCILCGHLPREERRSGEIRKTTSEIETMTEKARKKEFTKRTKEALAEMEGKSLKEKEKILHDLALSGAPLPEGKTESETEIIKKVRTALGLPQVPVTHSEKEKFRKAEAAGLIVPLEGKSAAEKEAIVQKQLELGLPLPEGRTASEITMIKRIKTTGPIRIPSEKIKKARAAGLLTPLAGKSAEQKEKILKGLVAHGIPLPVAKTSSEKKLNEKIRKEMGLPPEPKSNKDREIYNRAFSGGIITPLEGKTLTQKEEILRKQAEMGIPMPEGRTASEKALINNIKTTVKRLPSAVIVPSEKLRKAKAAGLITPLQGKTPKQKETILKGLAQYGIPLPEAKTASEKKLIDKVRMDMGLPPEPKSSAAKRKYEQAQADGTITPLEGKTLAQKEQILRKLAEKDIALPEGRTKSEKALIEQVKATTKPLAPPAHRVTSEKLRKVKEAGFLTPLEGKTPQQKEKILKGLAQHGIPLPEAKTASEKKLIDKVRADIGLPPEPKSSAAKRKYEQAQADGMITPLEGKTPAQKEQILRKLAEKGIALPDGRTKSEKALIEQVKATTKPPPPSVSRIPSQKVRKAKEAGLLTPLQGKTPKQKEKILKGLAQHGIPLPKAKTASEKKLIDKVRADIGLPPEPKSSAAKRKYEQAQADGIITPLEGKTPAQKEQILRKLAEKDIALPEGRTKSEKALIEQVKATTKPLAPPAHRVPSEKLRKVKEAGLLTPLQGKTPKQKEKILKGLAQHGIPLPEAKTASEKKLIDKVRADIGLPPEPKSSAAKRKYEQAQADGMITPLEGKTPAQKEQILRKLAEKGIALPGGRTKSEKALIEQVKATTKPSAPSTHRIPSEKLRKAKEAGLLTPLQGKTQKQKEKILKGLAQHGIPLPVAKTASDKKLIDKVRVDLGLPPEPKSSSAKQKYEQAIADGTITPLEGKTPAQKEQILRKLAEKGIALPDGRTKSEKALIEQVKATTKPSAPSAYRIPSEKLRKVKEAGLLTPLQGKTPKQKEKILKGLAQHGIPLPEAKTASEKKLIDKVRADIGLPPEPKLSAAKRKYEKAQADGMITPLEGKTPAQKEQILRKLAEKGIALPDGRTKSEKALIEQVKATTKPSAPSTHRIPSEKLRKAKEAGLLTPLQGKTQKQKEKILKGLVQHGIPLPEAKTASDKKLMDKVRVDLGLPPEPKSSSAKRKYEQAIADGTITPLEGKTPAQKEQILRKLAEKDIALPEGRTKSEKALIEQVKATTKPLPPSVYRIPSEKIRKAKEAGLLTPLQGKTPKQKEKILKGLAQHGIPLPEAKTASEKKLIDKVRADIGLPPEPKSSAAKRKYEQAQADGIITPLEGKTPAQKEQILRKLAEKDIALPEGRTKSEKALIEQVKATTKPLASPVHRVPSEKLRKVKEAGFLTPLEGKTPQQKEKILKGLAQHGIPLPEAKTASDKELMDKIRVDLGLPPEPKSSSAKQKYEQAIADGTITPLEGKTPAQKEQILRKLAEKGIALPEGRTKSEKALIEQVKATTKPSEPFAHRIPSEKLRKAKEAGLLTPLEGKTPKQKEKILKGLAQHRIPLPEAKTTSDKKIMDKVRKDMGLPPEPQSTKEKANYQKAHAAGLITPLEGKSPEQIEKLLNAQHDMGIPLPEGRNKKEKAIIKKIKAGPPPPLSAEKAAKLDKETAKNVKEGSGPVDECICPLLTPEEERRKISKPLPEPGTITSAKLKQAKAAGLLTPLAGKTASGKEKIVRGLAAQGLPLPAATTASDKKLVDTVRRELGLPPEPKTSEQIQNYAKAQEAGLIVPLEGKTHAEKEKILKKQAEMGIALPEGRTASENALIANIKATVKQKPSAVPIPSDKLRKAKAAGLITPLEGKTADQKEKILKGLAQHGIPLPAGKTPSENKLIEKVRKDVGLPPEPKSSAARAKYNNAVAAGIITPLEGKTADQKEKVIKRMIQAGVPLPEGRTSSEKALINKIRATTKAPSLVRVPSEKIRKAKEAGLLTPLEGKTADQKENILKGLAQHGIPIPEGKTPSEKKIIEKVRKDMGLPLEPKTSSARKKYNKAQAAGLITPLEGKTAAQKEQILKKLAERGVELPEGRTQSEKALIENVKATTKPIPSVVPIPSEKLRKAKAAGLITPLEGKTADQKEKILKGLAQHGIPLPEGKTPSEKKIIDKVRKEIGLPLEPKTSSARKKYNKAVAAGLITPLEGKTTSQKKKILEKQLEMGLSLPEGRTPSEKALIDNIKAKAPPPSTVAIPSEKLRQAQAAGLMTPLTGKKPKQKEKILRGLVNMGIPLPKAKTPSEKKIMDKVRKDMGLSPEPQSTEEKANYQKAQAAGLITPLEGKSPEQIEKLLNAQHDMGIPLPEGRNKKEKAIIKKIKAGPPPPLSAEKAAKLDKETAKNVKEGSGPVDECICPLLTPEEERRKISKPLPEPGKITSAKLKQAKAAGLLTPLAGKTASGKEKIVRGLAAQGLPLPAATTASDKKLVDTVRRELGLPPEPKTSEQIQNYAKAQEAGLIVPLEGKTHAEKEKILKKQAEMGITLPEGRTASENALIANIKATVKPKPSAVPIPPDKLRKAKAAGLITPLEGKTPDQKEKILKGLAQHGLPLPAGKTPSEKKLIEKVRKDIGLPPEPKTSAARETYNNAVAAGIITPLEGKNADQKEKAIKRMVQAGVPLPEGRTSSEKALINKVKATTKAPSLVRVPSAKIRKAKAAGFLTPLEGKTADQKEKILKGLAQHGIPLPEGKTASEKKLIVKVRKDMALPPEPKSSDAREKYNNAVASGIITPLEGKTADQKEKAIKRMIQAGVPLPEGRTSSEKALIDRVKRAIKAPSLVHIPSERLRKAKAAGLMTPLTGKSPEQKENILKGLAMHGLPLPEAKTQSEQVIADKVRKDLGLPPEPKTSAAKHKYLQGLAAGVITPLEGKSPAEKEKILRRQDELGIALPEGRTPSEKALITNIKATTKPVPPAVPIPSEKLRKAKAAGLITPLEGKSKPQKEKILRGLAAHGIPLPEAKTESDKKIIDKVRKEMGLPPEPRTSTAKRKYNDALAAGIITPLEGKTAPQKEQILRKQAEMGIPLPEGRTPSEKAQIKKIQETTRAVPSVVPIPSEKLRKAKAAGLLTPLEGKTVAQKENILKGLATHGMPLPEGKTASEKKLIAKVRTEVGLPPEPKTSEEKQKYSQAQAAGLITPLEGKSAADKEQILRGLAKRGIALPEARSASEKALMDKVRATVKAVPSTVPIPSERLRTAKAAGLITPLEGKTAEQKEKVLRGLAKHGVPLPVGKSASEKKIIDKVRRDVGLPPEPKTSVAKRKYDKALAAGIITPLEGKTDSQKEDILRKQAEAGLSLPEGRTASEKALIEKVKATTAPVPSITGKDLGPPPLSPDVAKKLDNKTKKNLKEGKGPSDECICPLLTPMEERAEPKKSKPTLMGIPSEKIRSAKAAGLLTPLEGKKKSKKKKILKGLVAQGIPLPEGKTESDKKLIEKVRKDMGLPPEPKTSTDKIKYNKALAAGIITPLEGKTATQQEAILKKQAELGIPLPEGRTKTEKALIDKVRAETKRLPSVVKPSEKLRKAKEEGLLTPLTGKTKAQKEKILKGLAKSGIPLPEGKTASEKDLIQKVRTEIGLPPEPKTSSERAKLEKAHAQGIITPLEGKNAAQKEKALKSMMAAGVTLPEGRSASEKALIAKIKSEGPPTLMKVASSKMRKAKAKGLITPLQGKTQKQKEDILKGLAELGVPLPKGETASEKSMIKKIAREYSIPSEPKTPSEKEIVRKAKADGLLTPLTGKSAAEKERILKGLAEAGLPMPEGATASEKSLVKKVRVAVGLPPEMTPSEKLGKIKTKAKGVSVGEMKLSKKAGAGISAEFQDILKTTKCDRACGCDRKKIRFKHSYVKIRVTSPDISSLCPCPEECVPGVKGGVFVDNEGIKVTVGRVTGVPSFPTVEDQRSLHSIFINHNLSKFYADVINDSGDGKASLENSTECLYGDYSNNDSDIILKYALHLTSGLQSSLKENTESIEGNSREHLSYSFKQNATSKCYLVESFATDGSGLQLSKRESDSLKCSSALSLSSALLLKTESSLSLSTDSYSNDTAHTISVISFIDSSFSEESSNVTLPKYSYIYNNEVNTEKIYYSGCTNSDIDVHKSYVYLDVSQHIMYASPVQRNNRKHTDMSIYNLSQAARKIADTNVNKKDSIIVISNINKNEDVINVVDKILEKKPLSNSSIIIVVSTSESGSEITTDSDSTICIQLSWNTSQWMLQKDTSVTVAPYPRGLNIHTKGKRDQKAGFFTSDKETKRNSKNSPKSNCKQNFSTLNGIRDCSHLEVCIGRSVTFDNLCQQDRGIMVDTYGNVEEAFSCREINMGTEEDKPCCCFTPQQRSASLAQSDTSALSEILLPFISRQGQAQGLDIDMKGIDRNYYESVRDHGTQASTKGKTATELYPTRCRFKTCASADDVAVKEALPIETTTCTQGIKHEPAATPGQHGCLQCSPEMLKKVFQEVLKEMAYPHNGMPGLDTEKCYEKQKKNQKSKKRALKRNNSSPCPSEMECGRPPICCSAGKQTDKVPVKEMMKQKNEEKGCQCKPEMLTKRFREIVKEMLPLSPDIQTRPNKEMDNIKKCKMLTTLDQNITLDQTQNQAIQAGSIIPKSFAEHDCVCDPSCVRFDNERGVLDEKSLKKRYKEILKRKKKELKNELKEQKRKNKTATKSIQPKVDACECVEDDTKLPDLTLIPDILDIPDICNCKDCADHKELIDIKLMKKMQSEQTQIHSGFNLCMKRRSDPSLVFENSFEGALNYYDMFPEPDTKCPMTARMACPCDEPIISKCACVSPLDPVTPGESRSGPLFINLEEKVEEGCITPEGGLKLCSLARGQKVSAVPKFN